ncbi:MAG TPA: tyrosine--tRNA ligase [Phycisphaerae bacterium]|nr:tyrosine--tRNA ligase [Phycisphaerae bacterium]HNU46657.1 tyrosine--tRNA ligase [Phycisphaerae bacterium]
MKSGVDIERQLGVLTRGCEHIYTVDELAERLRGGKRLRVKLGMDPTAPDLTLGHAVVLRKLRQFQDLGHRAVLIIGDYTAMIGDPTGRSKTRPMLTTEQVEANARTYLEQAGKVLDLSPDKLEVRHNSEWLSTMSCADVIRLLSQMTVARMLERDTFAVRQAEGKEIYLHELLYPLMQARDSVAIESDVELGGTDQTFNNLCGRDLQRGAGQAPQLVMTVPLLVGTDGKTKMSKSMGNYVGVTEPPSEMFGKLMRVPDPLMADYFRLLTDVPEAEFLDWCDTARHNPRDTKERLAKIIITAFHSAAAADAAAAEFARVHGGGSAGGLPDEIPTVSLPAEKLQDGRIVPVDLALLCGFCTTRGEARRLIAERGVRLNGQALEDPHTPIPIQPGDIIQRGKRQFVRLVLQ